MPALILIILAISFISTPTTKVYVELEPIKPNLLVIDKSTIVKEVLKKRIEMAHLCFDKRLDDADTTEFCAKYDILDDLLHSLGASQYTADITFIDLEALILNCLHESAQEPFEGKVEVTRVVLRRVASKRWPQSPYEVITSPKQFSWTLYPLKKFRSKDVSECFKAVDKGIKLGPSSFNHYFNPSIVQPNWAVNPKQVRTIASHTFMEL